MAQYEVGEPILNSPFDEPQQHWHLAEGQAPQRRDGRRPAVYYYRDPNADVPAGATGSAGTPVELRLVNLVRDSVKAWRG